MNDDDVRDEFSEYDGAYVLGALSARERDEFELHLNECRRCTEAVERLAGLPSLLATVPRAVAEAQPVGPTPELLLPSLIREVRSRERRRRWLTAAAAAAVAAVLSVAGLTYAGGLSAGTAGPQPSGGTSQPASAHPALATPMTVLAATPMRAGIVLQDVAWGTQVELRCSYPPTPRTRDANAPYPPGSGADAAPTYQLVVRSRTGEVQRLVTWQAVPGKTITVTGATSWSHADIASVQVQSGSGQPLLGISS